jgi:hypothetical protein
MACTRWSRVTAGLRDIGDGHQPESLALVNKSLYPGTILRGFRQQSCLLFRLPLGPE